MARHPLAVTAPHPPVQMRLDDLGTPLIDVTFVVVDFETTGVDPTRDRVTEVGAVRSHRGEVTGELATLVHPGRPVPPHITAITGITDALLRGCPSMEMVLPRLTEFLRGGVFVAHNASFDHRFLQAALVRDGREPLQMPVLDTVRLARRVLGDEVRSLRLSNLARHLGARTSPNHRALPDARATLEVLHALIERAASLGAVTLEDLLDLQRSTSAKAFKRVDLVRGAPNAPGVYRFLAPDGQVLYVGTAKDLRTRLRRYFGQDKRRRIEDLVHATGRVEWDVTATSIEAQILEVRGIHHHRPRFNRKSRHPEKAAWITLTKETFPRLTISGKPSSDRPCLGPVSSRSVAAKVIEALEESTEVRPCKPRLRVRQDHLACVLKDLGRCAAPCDGTQTREQYDVITQALGEILTGTEAGSIRRLRTIMRTLASRARFEQAALVRARLHALAKALDRHRRLQDMANLPRLVVARPKGTSWEMVEAQHGLLVRSWVAPTPGEFVGETSLPVDQPDRTANDIDPLDVEEILLLSSWIEHPDARLIAIEGQWSGQIRAGRLIAEAVHEARAVERRLRRDTITLTGQKVRSKSGKRPPDSGDDRTDGQVAVG